MGRKLRKLRHFRQARGLSQEELAYRAGVTVTTVHRAEKQLTVPHGGTAILLAQALKTTVEELEGRNGNTRG